MSKLPQIKDMKSVLKKHYGENFEILESKSKPLTDPGENYGSVIIAVDAKIKVKDEAPELVHLVAKFCPANEMLCKLFNIQETFKKELGMYVEVIPALESFEKEYGIEGDTFADLFAKCYGGRINLNQKTDVVDHDAMLVLENLKISGYTVGDRMIGFDKVHAELILKSLAHFHATPIALKLLKPDLFKEKVVPVAKPVRLGEIQQEDFEEIKSMVLDALTPIEDFSDCIEKVVDSLNLCLTGEQKFTPIKEPFSTLVHSDFWVNNTMLLYDKNEIPISNKIVDLQLLFLNSFAFDLLFFLYSSVIPSVLEDNFDSFLQLYYKTFVDRLAKFNIDLEPFSWEKFLEEIAEIAPKAMGQILFMFKPIMTERGQIKDMAEFDEEAFRSKDISCPQFAERVNITVRSFMKHKWI